MHVNSVDLRIVLKKSKGRIWCSAGSWKCLMSKIQNVEEKKFFYWLNSLFCPHPTRPCSFVWLSIIFILHAGSLSGPLCSSGHGYICFLVVTGWKWQWWRFRKVSILEGRKHTQVKCWSSNETLFFLNLNVNLQRQILCYINVNRINLFLNKIKRNNTQNFVHVKIMQLTGKLESVTDTT